jgi:hypothetical protein
LSMRNNRKPADEEEESYCKNGFLHAYTCPRYPPLFDTYDYFIAIT